MHLTQIQTQTVTCYCYLLLFVTTYMSWLLLHYSLSLIQKSLPMIYHVQLCLGQVLQVHHNDIFKIRHTIMLEQFHLNLKAVRYFSKFSQTSTFTAIAFSYYRHKPDVIGLTW